MFVLLAGKMRGLKMHSLRPRPDRICEVVVCLSADIVEGLAQTNDADAGCSAQYAGEFWMCFSLGVA